MKDRLPTILSRLPYLKKRLDQENVECNGRKTLTATAIQVTDILRLELQQWDDAKVRAIARGEGRVWGKKLLPKMVRLLRAIYYIEQKRQRYQRIARWTAHRSEHK